MGEFKCRFKIHLRIVRLQVGSIMGARHSLAPRYLIFVRIFVWDVLINADTVESTVEAFLPKSFLCVVFGVVVRTAMRPLDAVAVEIEIEVDAEVVRKKFSRNLKESGDRRGRLKSVPHGYTQYPVLKRQ